MLSFFLKIMNQKCGSYVCVQLLQTLNILFENIRNETSICEFFFFFFFSLLPFNSSWVKFVAESYQFKDMLLSTYYICIVSGPFLFLSDYLLSNNHVNSIIVHKFDFYDEEVMAYYISFLKTLSFRLNKHTIHFFYNEVRPFSEGDGRKTLLRKVYSMG